MYVRRQYTAEQRTITPATFTCAVCGFTAPCEVEGVGTGFAISPGLRRSPRAAEDAARRAEAQAIDMTRQRLALVPCPACGKRNPNEVRKWLTKLIAIEVAGVVLLGGGIALAIVMSDETPALVAGLTLALFGFLLVLLTSIFAPIGYKKVSSWVVFPPR